MRERRLSTTRIVLITMVCMMIAIWCGPWGLLTSLILRILKAGGMFDE